MMVLKLIVIQLIRARLTPLTNCVIISLISVIISLISVIISLISITNTKTMFVMFIVIIWFILNGNVSNSLVEKIINLSRKQETIVTKIGSHMVCYSDFIFGQFLDMKIMDRNENHGQTWR